MSTVPDVSQYQHVINWQAVGNAYRGGQLQGVVIKAAR